MPFVLKDSISLPYFRQSTLGGAFSRMTRKKGSAIAHRRTNNLGSQVRLGSPTIEMGVAAKSYSAVHQWS